MRDEANGRRGEDHDLHREDIAIAFDAVHFDRGAVLERARPDASIAHHDGGAVVEADQLRRTCGARFGRRA